MPLVEMLPEVRGLSRQDKIKLLHFLAQDLEQEEVEIITANRTYPMWSPDQAFSAAATMLEVLEEEKRRAQL